MTFIMGAIATAKTAPVVKEKPNDHMIQMRIVNRPQTVYRVPARVLGPPLVILALVTLIMLICLLVIIELVPNIAVVSSTRYHGFCTIPIKGIPEDQAYFEVERLSSYRVMPLRWTSYPELQAVTTDEGASEDLINSLRERFDIGDKVEKITVDDNGRHVSFIHDFDVNVTGIIDTDRCFSMDLDLDLVLTPEVLVLSIEEGAKFDISRVRSTLQATLPPVDKIMAMVDAVQEKCAGKPTYHLQKEKVVIRKRAVDAPSHDYIHFAGRRIQEIEISNLAELLQHEQDNKLQ